MSTTRAPIRGPSSAGRTVRARRCPTPVAALPVRGAVLPARVGPDVPPPGFTRSGAACADAVSMD
ncbi:hypothetical protein, partial [Streptacidiphilus neutrinimicus]|uniref:hypothetical protein n=1 Tax=Streptacidiphilus neutrinimicus TaxID=105420 RepID=UPI0013785FEC